MFPIGLLQGRGYIGSMMNIMTMIVIIGSMMKINFLRDTMAIKNGRPRKQKQKRTLAHCLASPSCDGLVHVRRREGVVEVTDSCWYQIIDFLTI